MLFEELRNSQRVWEFRPTRKSPKVHNVRSKDQDVKDSSHSLQHVWDDCSLCHRGEKVHYLAKSMGLPKKGSIWSGAIRIA